MEGLEVSEIAAAAAYDLGQYGALVVEENIVQHYSFGGQLVKQYTCESPPIMAIFHSDVTSGSMIVILVSAALIRVFPENGEFFDIPLSFMACRIFSSSKGVIIESERNNHQNLVEDLTHSLYYVLYRPDAPYVPLRQSLSEGKIIALCGTLVAILGADSLIIGSIMSQEKDKGEIISFSQNESKMSDSFSSSRHSRSSKRSRARTPVKRPISSPEMFANALGVPGYIESHVVSPISFPRLREIDHERRIPRPNSSLQLSRDDPFANDQSISTDHTPIDLSSEGDISFLTTCLGVISLEGIETPKLVTFSRDPQGETLIHLLSPCGVLRTYLLTQNHGDGSRELLPPLRQLENISSITHFYLGPARRTIDCLATPFEDLFGTIIAHKEVTSLLLSPPRHDDPH
jgi:hypothetical protein